MSGAPSNPSNATPTTQGSTQTAPSVTSVSTGTAAPAPSAQAATATQATPAPAQATTAAPSDPNLPAILPGETIGQSVVRRRAYGRLTPATIDRFLDAYRQTGTIVTAALAAGISTASIDNLRKTDPDFDQEVKDAKALWVAEHLDKALHKIGIEGIDEPIYNTKTGQLLGYKKVIQPQVTLAYARKFDPEYREKQDVAVSHSGGVMVVNAPLKDAVDWKNQFSNDTKRFDDAEFSVRDDDGNSNQDGNKNNEGKSDAK